MKNKKILLLTLPLIFNSLFLVSCQQTDVNTGKISSSTQKDADDVYVTSIEVTTPPTKTKYIPLERLYLSPQCGFASCEIGNKLTEEQQWAKLKLVKEIAEEVWG